MNLAIPYHLENFIGGNFIGPLSGNFIDNINPATGAVYGQIPDSNSKDVEVAVMAAKKAFPAWSILPVEKRFIILKKIIKLPLQDFHSTPSFLYFTIFFSFFS